MTRGPSAEWAEFSLETFGQPFYVWHDGAEFTALRRRWRADPGVVERMLRAGLSERDPVAAQAVAALVRDADGPREIGPALQEALRSARGLFRVRVAEALFALTGDPGWADEIVGVLAERGYWGDRIDAAIALAAFAPKPALVDGLVAGVQDRQYLVRYHCANTLLRMGGRPADVAADPVIFPLIGSSADPADWRAAAEALTAGWHGQ